MKRITLDNPQSFAKVARIRKKRNSKVKILPNPFGGVNTHLWSNEAYIVGIVPVVVPSYSPHRRNGRGTGRDGLAWAQCFKTNQTGLPNRKF
jgi:hypothetical protein